jgi:F-type H+-transporting ATPase subunit b
MHIDWWTLGLQTANVSILIWLLARFLFRPVARIVAERQQAAAALMSDAAAAKTAALGEQQKASAETARLAQERAGILTAAKAEADQLKILLDSAARAEGERQRSAAQAEIAAARHDAAQADADRASVFALDIAARLLDRLPRQARIAGFADGLAAELGKLPAGTLAQLGLDGAPMKLLAPRPLDPDELQTCRGVLAHALGREVSLEIVVDASLIAGLELEAPHAIVRNSLRNDLSQLKARLLAHDTDPA